MSTSHGGWWLETAAAAGAVFTDSLAGDAIIRTEPGFRVLLGAGSNLASAAQVSAGAVAAAAVRAGRFEDLTHGYVDMGGNVADLYDRVARLASGALLQPGAVDLASQVRGVLPVTGGGTGASNWAPGGLPFGGPVGDLRTAPDLCFLTGERALFCRGGVLLGDPGGTRYLLHVGADSNPRMTAIDAAGTSNLFIDFGEVRALLAGLRVGV